MSKPRKSRYVTTPPESLAPSGPPPVPQADALRIIGGSMRGRQVAYSGDPRTRPMKDRVREAVLNLLGPTQQGKHVLDLFAGTGALGLEAVSRGAARATFYERHFPTADIIRRNVATLGVENICEVVAANTFLQFRRGRDTLPAADPAQPWLVFCSPPFAFYVERQAEMIELLTTVTELAPPGSVIVAESDEQFDFNLLPSPEEWNVRDYPPARIGMLWLTPTEA